jgi:FAD/FMN-containing dehydrogenase
MRHFGPDLTGIFLNDTGAMGIKVRASLRIVEWPKATGHRSFAFDALEPMLAALSTIGRKGLAAECWGFDPYLQGKRLEREGIVKDFATLAGVIRSGRSVLGGVKSALQIAAAGRRAFANVEFALHSTVDARSDAALEADLAELTSIAESAGGRAIAATFPQAVRGVPFSNVPDANVIGPQGERSLPVNVVVPHSRALEAVRDIVVALEPHDGAMQALGVNWGYTMFAVSTTMVVIDVIFFWKDAPHTGPQPYRSWTHAAELSAAGALVDALRETLTGMFFGKGYAYLQIGKAYPYPAGLQPGARSLLEGIKQLVDPDRRMNPGSLQL